jgi:DNA-binding SARP family transcriptional activator
MDKGGERTRPRTILDVVGAAVAALLAFTAVPSVLIVVVGNPLSGGLGYTWRPQPRDALCVLAVAAWVAWAACCTQLVRAVVVHVRRGEVSALGGTSVVEQVAARIAVGVLALTSMGASLALSSSAGASAPAGGETPGIVTRHPGVAMTTPYRQSTAADYVVQPGDTLWSIANDYLADGAQWTALAALNVGRDMSGGLRFVDPDHVEVGWSLVLPADARGAHEVPERRLTASSPRAPTEHLPELVALGMGSLVCAALARRVRRRRRGRPFTGDLDLGGPLSDAAVDLATLLHRFDGIPALVSFEAANRLLARPLQGRTGPAVRAICVSPSGVSFWLTRPQADAPEGFAPVGDGAAWHVDHATLDDQEPFFPYCPIVLPIGEDEAGTWLVPLGPGDVLPLLGESAASLWRAARAAVGAWAWVDAILVIEDPDDPQLLSEVGADPSVARHLLFFGDPASLPPEVSRRTAVVTTAAVGASDLTILVDRHGATLHPIGRVVRPHLHSAETAQRLEELLTSPAAPGLQSEGAVVPVRAPRPSSPASAGFLTRGPVEVRLLTMTPRLEGLNEELPPNRARRAVELVAYLALHHPDVITSDRLRTRVLGSSDSDAASKTLFNTAYAARRAMGVDEHGELLFPVGTRNGLYQVSHLVTVDVHRAIALAVEGKAREGDLAIAYLRAALELVEGEPLANALSGYSWWEAEGHGGRVTAVLVDAACTLAALASGTGRFDLARWGLERARLVEPYSEALSRAAMELAAAEGDADRLRLEWRECQRRVDALDPGGSPSPRTESLYGELSRRFLVEAVNPDAERPRYASATND